LFTVKERGQGAAKYEALKGRGRKQSGKQEKMNEREL